MTKKKTADNIASAPTDASQLLPDNNNNLTQIASNVKSDDADFYDMVNNPDYIYTVSMPSLYSRSFPPHICVIEEIMNEGLYILAGAPKSGKSFLVLQMAYHISRGLPLWGYAVSDGEVIYLSLEDTERRLQERAKRMFGNEVSDNLSFALNAKTVDTGLIEQLDFVISKHKNCKLIIIDTLQRIRNNSNDKMSYASDYEIIGKLKNFADTNRIAILLVHHTRKQQAEDIYDMISGTNGLFGAADGAFVLHKDARISSTAFLDITSRDFADKQLVLRKNSNTLAWDYIETLSDINDITVPQELSSICNFINEKNSEWEGTATELVNILNYSGTPSALSLMLQNNANILLYDFHIKFEKSARKAQSRSLKLAYVFANAE